MNQAELEQIALNAQPVPLKEFQEFQMFILKEFIRVCEMHDLHWCPSWGTLLGAARHNGFIPWDDDIDVWMPASDYLRFREVCKTSLDERFYLQCHSENAANFITWQRIGVKNTTSLAVKQADIPAEWGVCIDIFPLAPVPSPDDAAGIKSTDKLISQWKKLTRKYVYAHDAKSLTGLKKWYHQAMAAGSDESNIAQWKRAELEFLSGSRYKKSGYLSDMFVTELEMFFPVECFESFIDHPFEDITVPLPVGYKTILDISYGKDWAEIPPEEKRVCHSGGGSAEVLVSLTEPYTKYLVS